MLFALRIEELLGQPHVEGRVQSPIGASNRVLLEVIRYHEVSNNNAAEFRAAIGCATVSDAASNALTVM